MMPTGIPFCRGAETEGVKLALVPVSKTFQKAPFDCGYPVLNEYFRLYALKNDRLYGPRLALSVEVDEDALKPREQAVITASRNFCFAVSRS
jgi:hypothetical protein